MDGVCIVDDFQLVDQGAVGVDQERPLCPDIGPKASSRLLVVY